MEYTKRERVTLEDGREVFYVEGVDGDGDPFVGYENVAVEPGPDPLAASRDLIAEAAVRLAKEGGILTTEEQVELVNVALGHPVQSIPIAQKTVGLAATAAASGAIVAAFEALKILT